MVVAIIDLIEQQRAVLALLFDCGVLIASSITDFNIIQFQIQDTGYAIPDTATWKFSTLLLLGKNNGRVIDKGSN